MECSEAYSRKGSHAPPKLHNTSNDSGRLAIPLITPPSPAEQNLTFPILYLREEIPRGPFLKVFFWVNLRSHGPFSTFRLHMSVFHAANATGGRCDNSSALTEEDSTYKENGCFIRFHRCNIKETYFRISFNRKINGKLILNLNFLW